MTDSSFEALLARDGKLIYSNVGDSMLPLIRAGRDLVVIEAVHRRLKRREVPLYRRDSGQYVLHRILRVRENDYVLCGDNRWARETGVTDNQILGVMTAVVRNGVTVPVSDLRYRLYVHLWCDLFPLRALILRALRLVKPSRKKTKA